MKKYRVIDWIDAEDHWEIVHEVNMEVEPAPGEMVVIVSSVEGLAKGDIIDGQGNLFKKAEPPAPPYGNAIQILEQEKQNLQNTINLIVENELPDSFVMEDTSIGRAGFSGQRNTTKTTLSTRIDMTMALRTPPITTVAKGLCTSAPMPVLNAIGRKPRLATKVVISTGRNRVMAASSTAFSKDRPFCIRCLT